MRVYARTYICVRKTFHKICQKVSVNQQKRLYTAFYWGFRLTLFFFEMTLLAKK